MTTQTAKLTYLRIAPRKVRGVGDLIKGLPVSEAEAQLMAQTRRPAKPLLKLLRSAVANAKTNQKIDPAHLFVVGVRVDGGPMLKRFLPRARGSASPLQKKMSNVVLTLGVNEKLKQKFTIVVAKKTKLPPGGDRPRKSKAPKDDKEAIQQSEKQRGKPGFIKRTFSRKAGAGE